MESCLLRVVLRILAPRGYHSTVAAPGTRNTYLWVLAHIPTRVVVMIWHLDPKSAEMNYTETK